MPPRVSDRAMAALVAAATLVFGIFRADDHPFWLDEAFTAAAAERTLGSMIRFLGHEAGMGPYYLVLWAWARIGTSEGWLRTLSVLGGAAAIAATYLFACRLIGRVGAGVAVVALFCNPFFLYNLTELRAYSWTMLLGVASTAAFLRFRATPSVRTSLSYGVVSGLMLGLLVFTVPLLVVHAAFTRPLWSDRRRRRLALLAAGVALVLLSPFVAAMVHSDQINWIPPLTPKRFMVNTVEALGGYRWSSVFGLGNLALLATFVRPQWRRADDLSLRVVLGGVVAMPIGLALLEFVQPVYLPRYLVAMLPLAVIGAVAGFIRLGRHALGVPWRRNLGIGLAALVLGAGLRTAFVFDIKRPEDLRAPTEFVRSKIAPGDAVVFSSDQVAEAAGYYWKPGPGHPSSSCHQWYFFRGTPAQLLAELGHPATEPPLTTTAFSGYTVAEVDRCPA